VGRCPRRYRIYGNELVDQLAKAATRNSDIVVFNRIPTSTLCSKLNEVVRQKWQTEWENCAKVLPKHKRQVENEYTHTPEIHGHGNWAQNSQGVPPPIEVIRQCNLSLQQIRPNSRSPNSPVHITSQ
jgi:hypothetical protein